MKRAKQLVYMKDTAGNNLRVFESLLEASEYLNVDYFELLKHIGGIQLEDIPFKFELREVRDV